MEEQHHSTTQTFEFGPHFAAFLERVLDTLDFQNEIREKLEQIIMTQEEFNVKIEAINTQVTAIGTTLDTVASDVAAEKQQVADFIAAHPDLDTSALDAVVTNLGAIKDRVASTATDVTGIFPDPPPPPPADGGETGNV